MTNDTDGFNPAMSAEAVSNIREQEQLRRASMLNAVPGDGMHPTAGHYWTSIIFSCAALIFASVAFYSSCNAKRIVDAVHEPAAAAPIVQDAPVVKKGKVKR